MDKVAIDPTLGAKLAGLGHSVELCDSSGHSFGWFQPAVTAEFYEGLEPPFSADELCHADDETGGRPLADILTDLERRP